MYPRFIERRLKDSLSDTRVILLSGPRQSGKTTLAEKIGLVLYDHDTIVPFGQGMFAAPISTLWEKGNAQ